MDILKFIFVLGINFSIFGFIWGLMMIIVRMFRNPAQPANQALDYTLRIVKYFLLVSVTANYINKFQGVALDTQGGITNLIVGTLVLTLYLLGKLRNRVALKQLGRHPIFVRFANSVDPKVERFLLLGSVTYFVFCIIYPQMVDNDVVNWFNNSILSIYDTPVIGWIFKVIAFFFLINILLRAVSVLGRLLGGKPLTESSTNQEFHYREQQFSSDEYSEYEEVQDDEKDKG